MITLGICPEPRKVANMISFLDVILKEIDALSKNGFVLERDGQVLCKGNVFLMGITGDTVTPKTVPMFPSFEFSMIFRYNKYI